MKMSSAVLLSALIFICLSVYLEAGELSVQSYKIHPRNRIGKLRLRKFPINLRHGRERHKRNIRTENLPDLQPLYSDSLDKSFNTEQRFPVQHIEALTEKQNEKYIIPGYSRMNIKVIESEKGSEISLEPANVEQFDTKDSIPLQKFNSKPNLGDSSNVDVGISCDISGSSLVCQNVIDGDFYIEPNISKVVTIKEHEKNSQNSSNLNLVDQEGLQSEGSGEVGFEDLQNRRSGKVLNLLENGLPGKVLNLLENRLSGKISSLFVDDNGTDPNCTTPKGEKGHCRHYRRCILHDVLVNLNMLLPYMCLRASSVGICCPDNPVIEVVHPDDNAKNSTVDKIIPIQPKDGCGLNTRTRIVNGIVSKPLEWTWMVALLRKNRFFCGGVLINDWYVLTAAHCTLGVDIKHLSIRLGEYNFNTEMEHQKDISISEIKRHAKFTTLTFQHDIALLKLREPVNFSRSVKTICLPKEGSDFADINATVAGWGTVSFGGAISPILRQVNVPVWKNSECDRTYLLETIDESFMCAGAAEDEGDACQGDSGGPLMALNENGRWEVIGLVSWGRRCGDPNFPGVYTRVTTYLKWISENAD